MLPSCAAAHVRDEGTKRGSSVMVRLVTLRQAQDDNVRYLRARDERRIADTGVQSMERI